MLNTVQLKLTAAPLRKATAWFLPGDDPALWLDEVTRWPVAIEKTRFYLLPAAGSGEVAGVLVIPAVATALPAGNRGQPYGEAVAGFFMPVDATLTPPVAPTELKGLCHYETMVYHPAYGLMGFNEHDVRGAGDFLQRPARHAESWNAAREIIPANRRLRSVRLEAPLALADLFGEESREIGSTPITELPPVRDEPLGKLSGKIAQGISSVLVRSLVGLTSLVPRSANIGPTWINHLENWAQGKLAGITAELERHRNKELHRLLELLEKNPEEGLRHAISLAQLAHRGKAPPSARLGNRGLDFNLQRLGGGRASDFWNIPLDIQSTLSKRYRDNAQREAKLGRYRRAAYIYAELLGDFTSAADVLRQGRFFREAALLYEKRLHNPLLAAECLAAGGLFLEAIELYEKHANWMEVANLYEQIGKPDEAKVALRKVVNGYLQKHDVVSAARLIEQRLHAVDEALALLASAWPAGKQAMQCLEERFAMLARVHRAGEMSSLITALGQQATPSQHTADLIGLLSRLAENTAHRDVRQRAAEVVRNKSATALTNQTLERSEELSVLRSLTRLVPHDRLLARDANRFRAKRPEKSVPRLTPPSTKLIRRLAFEKAKVQNLPQIGNWLLFETTARGFYAVSKRDDRHIYFSRGTWQGSVQSADWDDPAPDLGASLIFKIAGDSVMLARPLNAPLALTTLPGSDVFDKIACSVGTLPWLPSDTVQVAESNGTVWIVRAVSGRIVLGSFQAGSQVYSRDVTDELIAAGEQSGGTAVLLDATGAPQCVAIGYGNCLLVMSDQNALVAHKLQGRIVGLLPGHPSLPGWIVSLERGAVFISAGKKGETMLDDSMVAPRATYLLDGRIVLMSSEEGKVLQWHAGQLLPAGWFPAPDLAKAAIGIGPTSFPHELAICSAAGVIERWNVPV